MLGISISHLKKIKDIKAEYPKYLEKVIKQETEQNLFITKEQKTAN